MSYFNLQLLDTISSVAMAGAALFAAIIAFSQLKKLNDSNVRLEESNNDYLLVEKSKIVMEIDKRYESDVIINSRTEFSKIWNECEEIVINNNDGLDSANIKTKVNELMSGKLNELRRTNQPEYLKTMEIIGLWETVGLMYKMDRLDRVLLMELYDSAIIKSVGGAKIHIKKRQEDPNFRNAKYMENALYLLSEAEKPINERYK